jgi:hypothetical protein
MSANSHISELFGEKATTSIPTPVAVEDAKHEAIITVDDEEERRILRKIDWQ